MEPPMSPLEDFKVSMCLSPQDKLKSGGLLAQRAAAAAASKKPEPSAASDLLDSGWMGDFDDRLSQDIDWDVHDSSLSLDLERESDDAVPDFGFGSAASYLSPLRSELLLPLEDLSSEVSSSFDCGMSLAPLEPSSSSDGADAEKLLMSFDTMNFTIPSPTSSSSRKKRAALFGGEPPAKAARGASAPGCMSPSLKLKSSARAASPEELLEAAKAPADALLGVLSISAPSASEVAAATAAAAAAAASSASAAAATSSSSSSSCCEGGKKIGSYSPEARKLRIQKFHEKRKSRTWKKSIKYDCRKKLADDRPRIKGRFVRVLEDKAPASPASPAGDRSPASVAFTPPVTPLASPAPLSPRAMASVFELATASPSVVVVGDAAADRLAAEADALLRDSARAAELLALELESVAAAVVGDGESLRRAAPAAAVDC